MAAVKGRDTKPEIAVRKALHALGFRFRLHVRIGRARPDIVLPRYRVVIFVHGCFWHGHGECRLSRTPKSNVQFWTEKIEGNMRRDATNIARLLEEGWRVGVIWECAVRDGGSESVARHVAAWLREGGPPRIEMRSRRREGVTPALDCAAIRYIELGS